MAVGIDSCRKPVVALKTSKDGRAEAPDAKARARAALAEAVGRMMYE
jgi:hypothetical protein